MAPKHVKEAYRLLNKSIIRVEQPDVQLDEQEEPLGDVDEEETPEEADAENVAPPVNGVVNGGVNGEHPPPKEKEKEKKKKLKLSFEEYKSIANLLVLHLRCVYGGSEEKSCAEIGCGEKLSMAAEPRELQI